MKLIARIAIVVAFMFAVMTILTAIDQSTQGGHVSHQHVHQSLAARETKELQPMRVLNESVSKKDMTEAIDEEGGGVAGDVPRDDDVNLVGNNQDSGSAPIKNQQHEGIVSELKEHLSSLFSSHKKGNSNTAVGVASNTAVGGASMSMFLERLNFQENQIRELKETLKLNQEELLKALSDAATKMSNIHKSVDDMNRRIPMEWALKHYKADEQNVEDGRNGQENSAGGGEDAADPANDVPTPKTSMYIFLQYIQQHLNGLSHAMLLESLGIDANHEHDMMEWTQSDREWKPVSQYKLFPSQVRLAVFTGYWCLHSLSSRKAIISSCIDGFLPQNWMYDPTGSLRSASNPNMCLDGSKAGVNDPVSMLACVIGMQQMEGSVLEGQQWEYVFVDAMKTIGALRNKKTGLCLGSDPIAPSNDRSHQPHVVMLPCEGSCGALWTITANATSTNSFAPNIQTATEWSKEKKYQLDYSHERDHEPIAFQYKAIKEATDLSSKDHKERIACWVMTNPKNHKTKAVAINATWGQDCDLLLFMTTKHQAGLNTVVLSLGEQEDRHFLWRKSIMSWGYMYTHLLKDYGWFIRADDDSFLNMDNLRDMLKDYNATDKHFFGRRLHIDEDDFYSGGPGTIVSQGALQAFGDAMKEDILEIIPSHDTFADDAEIAVAFKKLEIFPEDTRDEHQLERFSTLSLADERSTYRSNFNDDFWYFDYSFYPPKEGADGISRHWIGSHYNTPQEMFMLRGLHEVGCEAAGSHPWDTSIHNNSIFNKRTLL
eukprot:m.15713 g.15713  ORF g.15713 m.15713 type:complete len:771 (-) comp4514_c0_seq1:214-2526(-)